MLEPPPGTLELDAAAATNPASADRRDIADPALRDIGRTIYHAGVHVPSLSKSRRASNRQWAFFYGRRPLQRVTAYPPPAPNRRRQGPETAQPCRCRAFRRTSLHRPICRPSSSCIFDRRLFSSRPIPLQNGRRVGATSGEEEIDAPAVVLPVRATRHIKSIGWRPREREQKGRSQTFVKHSVFDESSYRKAPVSRPIARTLH
jgi:hypothetical protein